MKSSTKSVVVVLIACFTVLIGFYMILLAVSGVRSLVITESMLNDNLNQLAQQGNQLCSDKGMVFQGVAMDKSVSGYALCLTKSPCRIYQFPVMISG